MFHKVLRISYLSQFFTIQQYNNIKMCIHNILEETTCFYYLIMQSWNLTCLILWLTTSSHKLGKRSLHSSFHVHLKPISKLARTHQKSMRMEAYQSSFTMGREFMHSIVSQHPNSMQGIRFQLVEESGV